MQFLIECEHAALDYLSLHSHISPHQYAESVQMPADMREGFVNATCKIGHKAADLKQWQKNAARIAKAQGSARRMDAQRNAEYLRLMPVREAWKRLGEGLYSPAIWALLDQMIDAGA